MPLSIAIVGRPNVGKSTLFNRLAGKKLAIVDDQPGVTRDRRYAHGQLGDLELTLIDTAGYEDVHDQSLESRMRVQTQAAIDEADIVLFLMDAREGLTPLDKIFADQLRPHDHRIIMLANKAEGHQAQATAEEARQLGFGPPILISAEHGEGMSELYEVLQPHADLVDLMAADQVQETLSLKAEDIDGVNQADLDAPTKPIRIAIIGRPNAGKSTLINRLLGEDRLLTGPEAGITRDAISVEWTYEGRPIRLVDTAGLRRKSRVQEKLEKLSTNDTIRAITFAEVVILVMDEANAFETQDLQIADLVEREGRALVYCISKWDQVDEPQARLSQLLETANRMLPQLKGTPLVALSSLTGRNIDKLMPSLMKTYRNWSARIKTRDLNDWLALAVQRHPPPAVDGKRVRPKYMAQIKARPPTFVLFATRSYALPDHYKRYMINSIRESFDMPGVPIRLSVKSSRNPFAEASGGARSSQSQKSKSNTSGKPAPKPGGKKSSTPRSTNPIKPRTSRPKLNGHKR
jgi:GTP-binding protein